MSSSYDNSTDLYDLLGIAPNASSEDIQAAYLRAAAYWHPDRNKSENALEMMVRVNEARSKLTDSTKRAVYDQDRGQGFRQQPGPSGSQRAHSSSGASGTGDSEGRRPESDQGDSEVSSWIVPIAIGLVVVLLFYFVLLPLSVDKLLGWDTYPRDGIDPIGWVRRWF
jgi:curved DNA-binding protein CbpA